MLFRSSPHGNLARLGDRKDLKTVDLALVREEEEGIEGPDMQDVFDRVSSWLASQTKRPGCSSLPGSREERPGCL